MKQLEQLQQDYPELSSFVIFGRWIQGKNITIPKLTKLIKTHVDKEDYKGIGFDKILAHFRGLSLKKSTFKPL